MAATWVTYLGYVAVASVIWFLVDFISCVVAARVSITFVRRASVSLRRPGTHRLQRPHVERSVSWTADALLQSSPFRIRRD